MAGLMNTILGQMNTKTSTPNKWRILDSVLTGQSVSNSIDNERARLAKMEQARQLQDAQDKLVNYFSQTSQPTMKGPGMDGEPIGAAQAAAPTPQGALPLLAQLQALGGDPKAYTGLLDAVGPKVLKPNEVALTPDYKTALYTNRDKSEGAYSMTPGMQRRDASNNIVAEVPLAPQIVTASPELNVFSVDKNPAPAPSAGGIDFGMVDRLIGNFGGKVTSAARDPAKNAAVGGVPNSYHLTGQARDTVPPPGMSMDQYAQTLKTQLPGADVINEGDHVHIEPAPNAGAPTGSGLQVLQRGQPKAKDMVRPATAEEKAAYGVSADVPAQIRPDGSINVISGVGANLKPRPATIQAGYVGNQSAIRNIQETIKAIEANPKALGLANMVGDEIRQRVDPKGVGVRAMVANVGSLVRHERSGAAVTAAETPYLKPFIPSATDSPKAAIEKLKKLENQFANANREIDTEYGEGSGYRPMGGSQKAAEQPKPAAAPRGPVRVSSPAEAAKLKPGTRFIGHDGIERVRQ